MTSNFFLALKFWFETAWNLMTSFYIPGTNVTPAGMILFGASAYIGIKFIKYIFFTGGVNEKTDKD